MCSARFILVLLVSALPSACLEMPIARLSNTDDADASTDGGIGEQQACLDCLGAPDEPGPGCGRVYTACRNDSKCGQILDCGFGRGCFQGAQSAFYQCGSSCLTALGVLQPDEPVLMLAAGLFQCLANGACAPICFSGQ